MKDAPTEVRSPILELKDQTIHIRMAGIDAPEVSMPFCCIVPLSSLNVEQAAHFGHEAQEYSEDALQWLRDTVQGKRIWCQLLLRDQYGRIVRLHSLFQ